MAIFRFGVFELDQASGELRRQGRRVHLARQPCAVLIALLERPGQVIDRGELRRVLWDETTFVEFDRGLNYCIAAVRSAIGDQARHPRFIETMPRRGYRFIADVHRIETDPARVPRGAARAVAPASVASPPLRRRRSTWTAIAATGLVVSALVMQTPARVSAHTRTTASAAARAAFDRGLAEAAVDPAASLGAFAESVRLDERFAEAYYFLADAYLARARRREMPADAAIAAAKTAAIRALRLEDRAGTRQLLGLIRLEHDGDGAGARADLGRAVALARTSDMVAISYAQVLSATGDDDGAIEAVTRAEHLSPSCELVFLNSAIVYYRARRYDDALARLARAEALGPPAGVTRDEWRRRLLNLGLLIHIQRADWPAARAAAAGITAASGAPASRVRRFEALDPREAVEQFLAASLDRLRRPAIAGTVGAAEMARLHAAAGQADDALAWLQRAALERDPDLVFALRDPVFDAVRARPDFHTIEATMHVRAEVP